MAEPGTPEKLLVLPSWYPPDGGRFFRENAEALASEGLDVDVLVNRMIGLSRFRKRDVRYLKRFSVSRRNGIREVRSFMIKIPLADNPSLRLWIRNTCRLFGRYRKRFGAPGMIMAHAGLWAGLAAYRISRKYGIPYIIVEHRSRFIRNTEEARGMIPQTFLPELRRAMEGARHVVAVSAGLKEGLLKIFPAIGEKTVVIPNMVDTEYFSPVNLPKHPGPAAEHAFTFLYAGILEHVKGVDILLRSFAALLQTGRTAELRITGRGSRRRELERLAGSLGLVGKVRFLGYLDRKELLEEYRSAGAFVLPSRFEAFGVVLIEAMAVGLPVIATRSGGPASIVDDDTGILTGIEDQDGLSGAMCRIMDERDRYDPVRIRQRAIERYNRKVVARQFVNLLHPGHDRDRA